MKPVRHFIIIGVLIFFSCLHIHAIPARGGKAILRQPDGTTFTATLRGDEFFRLLTTADGNAIIQEDDGYYCYAVYGPDGSKSSTGVRVGTDAPAEVLSASRQIPYGILQASAAARRASVQRTEEPLMLRIARKHGIGGPDTRSETTPKEKHGIVILAAFKDVPFTYTKADFEALLSLSGYNKDGATGSAMDYFNDQFDGMYNFTFEVSDIVTLSEDRKYYGANDTQTEQDIRAEYAIKEACELADSKVDFSKFDDDEDGEADNVFVFFAGGDEAQYAGDDCIWSHAWYLKDGGGISLTLDGVRINRYACSSELATTAIDKNDVAVEFAFTGIGTFCHEYSHTLGLPDFYDTDYEQSGGIANGLWYSTSLMDGGGYNNGGHTPPNFNAIEREMLKIADVVDLEEKGNGQYTISPIEQENTVYRINGDVKNEYFLIECRRTDNWDKYIYADNYSTGIVGTGTMLVYHVDKSGNTAGKSSSYNKILTAAERWDYNEVNAYPGHQCADLIEAADLIDPQKKVATDVRQVFFPQRNVTSFTPEFWNGKYADIILTDITGNDDGTVTFSVTGSGVPKDSGLEVFQDKVIVSWNAHKDGYEGESHIEIGSKTFDVSPDKGGRYSIVVGGLENNTEYTAQIYFEDKTVAETIEFKTGKYREGAYPFIFLKTVAKNDDGSFKKDTKVPLILYNAPGLNEEAGISWIADAPTDGSLTWYFNDSKIERGEDGYYTITESGTLKAVATYEGDTTDVIVKEITVK